MGFIGNERAFLAWFHDRDTATRDAVEPATVDQYLRTLSGREGVQGVLGVYRAAFTTIDQTAPLTRNKVCMPLVALGGEEAQGAWVRKMVQLGGPDRAWRRDPGVRPLRARGAPG